MTTPLLKKFNYKDQQEIFILHAPSGFSVEINEMKKAGHKATEVSVAGAAKIKKIQFILSFVQTKKEVEAIILAIHENLQPDAVVWFAYPKGTSKKYKSEINRDNGWEALGKKGFEAVRAVAIDEDWSGMRFRQVEFIKTMKRNSAFAMTTTGKIRTAKK